jgi:SAM-dependent methyltransferase
MKPRPLEDEPTVVRSGAGLESDRLAELSRYDARAEALLAKWDMDRGHQPSAQGSQAVELVFRAPYVFYEQAIRDNVQPEDDVLELGAGMGLHTKVLIDTGARVTATDISRNALAVLKRNLGGPKADRLTTCVADLGALPFDDAAFDVVACAGSLSYGDAVEADAEVRRVLRSGGAFVSVDSLNHNPIYRFNRWVNYIRNRRTRGTLVRMPRISRIEAIVEHFRTSEVRFFGCISWIMPLLIRVIGSTGAARLSDGVDALLSIRRSAFKFVLIARGKR